MRVLSIVVAFAMGCAAPPAGIDTTSGPEPVSTFWLPTRQAQFGASARVSPQVCVGLVWSFTDRQPGAYCDDDFGDGFPFAVVVSEQEPCGAVWDHRPNAVVQSIRGCIAPTRDRDADELDITAAISSALYVGEIHFVAP